MLYLIGYLIGFIIAWFIYGIAPVFGIQLFITGQIYAPWEIYPSLAAGWFAWAVWALLLAKAYMAEKGMPYIHRVLPMIFVGLVLSSCNPDLGMKSLTLYECCGTVETGAHTMITTYGATKYDLDAALEAAKSSKHPIVVLSAEKASLYPKRDTLYLKMPNMYEILTRN